MPVIWYQWAPSFRREPFLFPFIFLVLIPPMHIFFSCLGICSSYSFFTFYLNWKHVCQCRHEYAQNPSTWGLIPSVISIWFPQHLPLTTVLGSSKWDRFQILPASWHWHSGFQPWCACNSGYLKGGECLVAWCHPLSALRFGSVPVSWVSSCNGWIILVTVPFNKK